MFLKSLELVGFKSFAKQTVLEFEEGLTAVVGPNGSGKSNIADAIRWVLGAQSKKAVRGKVASDVIFSGSGTKGQMSMAEVSLTFDNQAKILPFEFEEVVVTRRLYRSGDGEYLVNGAKVRLTDLQHAFAVAGMGAEHYTVISQGMVDQVLSQTPAQRRALFEEAAGVRQFYLRRDEAKRKLSETTTNLGRVEDIIRELEPRLKSLKRQASTLAKREEIEAKLREAHLAHYGYRYRGLAAEQASLQAKQSDLNREFTALRQELDELGADVESVRKRGLGLKVNELLARQAALQDERAKTHQQLTEAVTAKNAAQATLDKTTWQRKQLEERLGAIAEPETPSSASRRKPADDREQQIKEALAALQDIEQSYQQLTKRLQASDETDQSAFRSSLKKLKADVAGLRRAITQQASYEQLARLADTIETTTKTLTAQSGVRQLADDADLAAELEQVLAKRDQAVQRVEQLRLEDAKVKEAAKVLANQRQRESQEKKALQRQLTALDEEAGQAQRTIQDGTEHIGKITKSFQGTEHELHSLESEISKEQQAPDGLESVAAKEVTLQEKRRTYEAYREELSGINVELAKVETRLDDLTTEAKAKLGGDFPPPTDRPLPAKEQGEEKEIARLERRMMELGGIDPEVTKEFGEVETRQTFLTSQAEDLRQAKDDLEQVIRQLERKSQTIFREAFQKINDEFGTYFTKLFGGGKAALALVTERPLDDEEPTEQAAEVGIEIKATPPGKRLQNLRMLSGGERALTSVALLFAILKVNPSPFVMLDEVDAALDEANTGRFAELLAELYHQTQFIVVTHNRDTMKKAGMLYGVTMDETGISTLLSIKLTEAEKVAESA